MHSIRTVLPVFLAIALLHVSALPSPPHPISSQPQVDSVHRSAHHEVQVLRYGAVPPPQHQLPPHASNTFMTVGHGGQALESAQHYIPDRNPNGSAVQHAAGRTYVWVDHKRFGSHQDFGLENEKWLDRVHVWERSPEAEGKRGRKAMEGSSSDEEGGEGSGKRLRFGAPR